ncbi:MAG: YggT family protein [Halioglobus sp.]
MGAINEIIIYLVQTLVSLYLIAMLLRFLLQLVRADFYNPICQFLVKATNPLVVPMRRLIPGLGGIDLATLILALVLQMAAIVILMLIHGVGFPNPLLILLWAVLGILGLLVNIYFFGLLAMIILSWVASGSGHPAIYLLHQLTEPVMAPVRKILPPMGGLDLSPILLFVLINIIQIVLRNLAVSVGLHPALVIGL